MIFSNPEDKKKEDSSECESKEKLETIIRSYMVGKKYEDIAYLKKNFQSTDELIFSIRSSLTTGLMSQNVQNNRMYYGQNIKKVPDSFPQLRSCFLSHFKSTWIILYLVVIFSTLAYSIFSKNSMVFDSSLKITVIFTITISIQIGVKYYWSSKLQSQFLKTVKKDFYQVIRNGCHIQVQQSQLVVGDIVELGFNQKVPATGLMITNKEIFLTQNNKIKPKLSLQQCFKQIQKMTILQLKLQEQNGNMISPVVLRGSQLLQGSVFSIILISVNQEQLLSSNGFRSQNQFTWAAYEETILKMQKRWKYLSLFVGVGTGKIMLLNILTQIYLSNKSQEAILQKVFLFLLQISAILVCLSFLPLKNFLQATLLKFLSRVSRKSEFKKLLNVRTLICDQVKVFEQNEVEVIQLVFPDRHDLISPFEIQNMHSSIFQVMNELQGLFKLKFDKERLAIQLESIKYKKIVYLHKQFHRIISVYSQSNQNKKLLLPTATSLVEKSRKTERSQTYKNVKQQQNRQKKQKQSRETQEAGRFLKIPNISNNHFNDHQNLNQIIQYKCKIKSRSVLGTFVGLAENGLRTYYYEPFSPEIISQIQLIYSNGNNIQASSQVKQKMILLSKKLNLVYGLMPIIISFSEGSYSPFQSKCLVCIIGIRTQVNQTVIKKVKMLNKYGISAIFTIGKVPQTYNYNICEEAIMDQLKSKGLIEGLNDQIIDADKIRKMLGRLICPSCFFSKCECKEKNKVFTNIQNFIENLPNLKIIYNVDRQNFEDIKKILQQTSPTVLSIRGQNTSITNQVNSVQAFMQFIGCIQSSTILFYAFSIVFFNLLVISWFFSKLLDPLQIITCYFLFVIFLYLSIFMDNENYNRKNEKEELRIINENQTILIYTICFFVLLGSQLFQVLHSLIPEYADDYDFLIEQQSFSPQICKYGAHHSVTNNFNHSLCSTQSFLQFSRLSTLILVYVFSSLWILSVCCLKNFTSKISIFLYPGLILIFLLIVQKCPNLLHTYSNGLTWQHYLIVYSASIITNIVGYLIGNVLIKIGILRQIKEELSVKIENEKKELGGEESGKLKQYYRKKKLKKQQSHSIFQKFISNF